MKIPLFTTILLVLSSEMWAQGTGIDAGRVYLIEREKDLIYESTKSQNKRYAALDANYEYLTRKLERNTDFLREFNNYLDDFKDVISMVAEAYGIYYESSLVTKNLQEFSEVIAAHPENSIAVALSSSRNKVYNRLYVNAGSIIADIQQVCFGFGKMTEKEKMQLLGMIRVKLKEFNRLVKQLNITLRYTTFTNVLHDTFFRYQHYLDKEERRASILNSCKYRWSESCRSASSIHAQ